MKTESDTPRTDDQRLHCWIQDALRRYKPAGHVVSMDFARTLERELNAAQERIAELEAALEAERNRTAEEMNCQQGMHAMEVARLQQRVAELEAELESHAWEISPAMAQAKIDELNAKIERLEAQQPHAPQFLERPDAPGWWWVWSNEATPPRWLPVIVKPGYLSNRGIWLRATPPQWTPTSEEGKG